MTFEKLGELISHYEGYAVTEPEIDGLNFSLRSAASNQLAEIEQRKKSTPFYDLAKTFCISARKECLGREDGRCATNFLESFLEKYTESCEGIPNGFRDSEAYVKCMRLYYLEGKDIETVCEELGDEIEVGPDRRVVYKRISSANTDFANYLYYFIADFRRWLNQL